MTGNADKTTLANRALAMIGVKPIDNLDAATGETAERMRLLWEAALLEVQSEFYWQELMRRVELTPAGSQPVSDETRFLIPQDTARILRTTPAVSYITRENFLIVEGSLASIVVEALVLDPVPGNWTSHLQTAVVYQLAALAAVPLRNDVVMAARFEAKAAEAARTASRAQAASLKGPERLDRSTSWTSDVYGGGGGRW